MSHRKSLFDEGSVRSKNKKKGGEKLSKEDAMNMVLSASIIKKKEWEHEHRLTAANLYELYSEFSSMIVIAKSDGAYAKNLN